MNEISKTYQAIGTESHTYNERNDCTVRAYAIATGIDYKQAHAELLLAGRKMRHGFNCVKFYTEKFGKPLPRMSMETKKFITFFAMHGSWIIRVRGHVFAVVDGKVHDWRGNENCHVLAAWRVR